jgi:hypothetical protein
VLGNCITKTTIAALLKIKEFGCSRKYIQDLKVHSENFQKMAPSEKKWHFIFNNPPKCSAVQRSY